jgi:hypothetical protein
MIGLSRRTFLSVIALLAPARRVRALAPQQKLSAISLDEFVELSGRLLQRTRLDREVAQIYLDALSADADTAVHLATLYQSNGNPTPEQAELSRTIIEWWYTGTYTIGKDRKLATHSGALMWDAMGMPAPGTCSAPFGAWAQPPQSIA